MDRIAFNAVSIATLFAFSLIAVEPTPRQVHHDPADPYTIEEMTNIVAIAKLPEGAELVDVGNGAKWAYAGLEATFSLDDLNDIHAASKDK